MKHIFYRWWYVIKAFPFKYSNIQRCVFLGESFWCQAIFGSVSTETSIYEEVFINGHERGEGGGGGDFMVSCSVILSPYDKSICPSYNMQDETRNIDFYLFGAAYIRCLTVAEIPVVVGTVV